MSHITSVMWFATTLVEELSKTNGTALRSSGHYDMVNTSIADIMCVFERVIALDPVDIAIIEEGIKCFQSWVMFAQRVWESHQADQSRLRNITPWLIQKLHHKVLFRSTAYFLVDTLENFPTFFSNDDLSSLAHIFTDPTANSILEEFEAIDFSEDAETFGRLMLAYGDATVQDLAKAVGNLVQQKLLNHYIALVGCQGYPGVEQHISTPALEFWQTYVEFLTDALFDAKDEDQLWIQEAKQRMFEVIEVCWRKIRFPDSIVFDTWDLHDRTAFNAFRADVQDLLQSSFTLLGLSLYENLTRLTLHSISAQSWLDVEASLFCLNSLADAVSESTAADDLLREVFKSPLFVNISRPGVTVPLRTQQSMLDLIASSIPMLQRHRDYLLPMMDLLFTYVRRPVVRNVSAKAILNGCSACRKVLYPHIKVFLQQYKDIMESSYLDSEVKEKVTGAVTCIVQAVPSPEDQLSFLQMLLAVLGKDTVTADSSTDALDKAKSQLSWLSTLNCLAAMGKALQVPDDESIDLDAEMPQDPQSGFWTLGPGSSFQQQISQILMKAALSPVSNQETVEAICCILRTGYKETSNGPLVLPYRVTTNLLAAISSRPGIGGLDYILAAATSMFLRRRGSQSPDMVQNASDCLVLVADTMSEMRSRSLDNACEKALITYRGCTSRSGNRLCLS